MHFQEQLQQLAQLPDMKTILSKNLVGLEKECLRVAKEGGLSQTPHPAVLGAPLTHRSITTDYSSALLEFITPPLAHKKQVMNYLQELHQFVYENLENEESLWPTSMPCVLNGEKSVPIAKYGDSNIGQMKYIYRLGLAYRYGRMMQVIAGVHYNFSVAPEFWAHFQKISNNHDSPQTFQNETYLGMVRNIQRYGWIIPYLFGASPAICKSFLQGCTTELENFDQYTYYEPYATSLRLGNIGYQNTKEEGAGVHVCYKNLKTYVESLEQAINTPAKLWEEIDKGKAENEYRQLNTHILQIENEYYSTVRPKQILRGLEKPTEALKARGIQYVELRSLDVNVFAPLGICERTLYFVETFMLYCLLKDSPTICKAEHLSINQNLLDVAHKGRQPHLTLNKQKQKISLKDWGIELLDEMQGVCDLLTQATGKTEYQIALDDQYKKMNDPNLTPSAKMLAEMRTKKEAFYTFVKRKSMEHQAYFSTLELDKKIEQELIVEAQKSHQKQAEIEAADTLDFKQFINHYFKK